MSKPRKAHREATHVRRQGRASCGAHGRPVSAAQFVWIPREYQCDRCFDIPIWWGFAKGGPKSATPEMQTTVETIVLAIHRLAECPVVPHEHVWLPYVWDDIRRAVEELLRTDERLEWRQPRSRCGGAID